MKLQIGEKMPNFSLSDQNGNLFCTEKMIGKKILVVYFYPKNFTPGCTKEACSFRDHYENFIDMGAEVIGISSDSVKSHQRFSKKYDLPFLILADPNRDARRKFGVKGYFLNIIPGRETFIIDKKGIVRFKFNNLMAFQHVEKALETVKKLTYEH